MFFMYNAVIAVGVRAARSGVNFHEVNTQMKLSAYSQGRGINDIWAFDTRI